MFEPKNLSQGREMWRQGCNWWQQQSGFSRMMSPVRIKNPQHQWSVRVEEVKTGGKVSCFQAVAASPAVWSASPWAPVLIISLKGYLYSVLHTGCNGFEGSVVWRAYRCKSVASGSSCDVTIRQGDHAICYNDGTLHLKLWETLLYHLYLCNSDCWNIISSMCRK